MMKNYNIYLSNLGFGGRKNLPIFGMILLLLFFGISNESSGQSTAFIVRTIPKAELGSGEIYVCGCEEIKVEVNNTNLPSNTSYEVYFVLNQPNQAPLDVSLPFSTNTFSFASCYGGQPITSFTVSFFNNNNTVLYSQSFTVIHKIVPVITTINKTVLPNYTTLEAISTPLTPIGIAASTIRWRESAMNNPFSSDNPTNVHPIKSTTYIATAELQGCISNPMSITINGHGCGKDITFDRLKNDETITRDAVSVPANVIVPNGLKLIIDGSFLQFAPNVGIIVEPGGYLEITNSTLQSCDPAIKWDGIEIYGDPNNPIRDPQIQGSIVIQNSVIKDASIGILLGKKKSLSDFDYSLSGGVLSYCQSNSFYNNNYSIYALPYNFDDPTSITGCNFEYKNVYASQSGFSANRFLLPNFDNKYHDVYEGYSHIQILGRKAWIVTENEFYSPHSPLNPLLDYGAVRSSATTDLTITGNNFLGDSKICIGDHLSTNLQVNGNRILSTGNIGIFNDIYGIYLAKTNPFIISSNTFSGKPYYVSVPTTSFIQQGIFGINAFGTIENNLIETNYQTGSSIGAGINLNYDDPLPQAPNSMYILKNTIQRNENGISINNTIPSQPDLDVKIYCNTLLDNSNAGILVHGNITDQGKSIANLDPNDIAASNTFGDPTLKYPTWNPNGDILYYPYINLPFQHCFNYFYDQNVPFQTPKANASPTIRTSDILFVGGSGRQFIFNGPKGAGIVTDPNASACSHTNQPPFKVKPTATVSGLKLYPNPSTNFFNLEVANGNDFYIIEVLDLCGKVITTYSLNNSNQVQFNTESWNAGMYIVRVKNLTKEEVTNLKFIKQ